MNHESPLVRTQQPAQEALKLHPLHRGKIETACKCPIESFDDFSIWYTPGVAAPSRAIAEAAERVYDFTNKGNTVARAWCSAGRGECAGRACFARAAPAFA